ncbi:MAG TPA: hypothetical protein VLM89_09030 [Phycisphaerae bacterium]|nr:hypothetical protein [Phycisphaerae bacterium]
MATEATLALAIDPTAAVAGLQRFDRAMAGTTTATSRFVERMKRDFSIVAAAAGGAVVGLTAKFVTMAGSVNETRSKFDVVFRGMEQDTLKWATGYGDAVGRSTQEIQKHLAAVQDLFVPLGFAREDAAELSKGLTRLAIDVASFSNAADADVLRDFTSALVGNTEVVRKYGVVISENRMEQEAFAQGLNKTYGQLNDLEKVLLRYKIIQKGSSDAVGDAVRTADSYANQMKRLKANADELGVALGDRLLPAANKALTGLNAWLESNRTAIDRWAKDFQEGVGIVTGAMDTLYKKTQQQSSFRTMYEGLMPSMQKSVLEAYKSQTGRSFGYETVVAQGIMGGGSATIWRDPADEAYARRLIESYVRAQTKRAKAEMQQQNDLLQGPDDAEIDAKELLGGVAAVAAARRDVAAEYAADLRFERELLRLTNAEREVAVTLESAKRDALREGNELMPGQAAELRRLVGELQATRRMAAIGDEIGEGFTRGFSQATMHARNLGNALDYLGDAAMGVVDRILQITIWEPMAQGISKSFTNLMAPKPSAMGDAFSEGRLQAFGLGGVVSRPTLFGFTGGIGLMGEAGSEAIMPLRRTSSGRLGVEATGGSGGAMTLPTPIFNVTDATTGKTMVEASDVKYDGQRLLVGMVLKDRRNNGPISRGSRK